ncbi:MAG: accessory gene regulator B family protein [Syntrophomonadaceae bacterium]|nr:accessory gene regulator B family protein [Syntrophomonadaceae bacterium]MDD4550037.1 accessory gene regulator B family protein [Syntrophomonadaceae bacterium]
MINTISRSLAVRLGGKLDVNKDSIDLYAYGLEIVLGTAVQLSIIAVLAYILGIFPTTIVFLLTFCFFRWLGGGVHLSTFVRCSAFSLVLSLSMGSVALMEFSMLWLVVMLIMSVFIAVYVCIAWVPAGTEKKMISDKKLRLKQKKEMLLFLTIWVFVVTLCMGYNSSYVLASLLGLLWSCFMIMPCGYRFMGVIDNFFKKEGGEECV